MHPDFSYAAQSALRTAYGVLLFLQVLITLPGARRFFCSERYGGYVETGRVRDVLYHPVVVTFAGTLWLASAVALILDRSTLVAAVVALAACRFLLIEPRWHSLSRGFGAVGQITGWFALLIALLELSRVADYHGLIRSTTVMVFRVDFALIMVVAGIYKVTAGYLQNDGFERALANPWWCYWSRFYSRVSPASPLFAFFNHSAYIVEIGAGLLMLTPLSLWGALAIAASFAMLALNLRLTYLPGMVVAAAFLFAQPGDFVDRFSSHIFPAHSIAATQVGTAGLVAALTFLGVYAVSIVLVRCGLYYNFFLAKRLPEVLQIAVDRVSQIFVITIWRVFTVNVINFYVDVAIERRDGTRRKYERIGLRSFSQGLRYAHAGEFVALCTSFTALKYFSDRQDIFEQRVVRYAKTVPHEAGESVILTYVSIEKNAAFRYVSAAEFAVDCVAATVLERALTRGFDVRSIASTSKVVKGSATGSYAPPRV
ncbi:MAG: hypothetical protein JO165_07890 [Candidatus Eremiobacteraeota bacterium]|nr:hypothetical protein [Candidatus Eremiobacteraeota bacterium]